MNPQLKLAAYKNVQTERDLVSSCLRSFSQVLPVRDRNRQRKLAKGVPALAAAIVIALFLTTSAFAQERQHAYSEYTYWFGGAFENGHAFSSTVGGRNYQLESRYERLIYWSAPFAVRWVFDVVPVALVDRYTVLAGEGVYGVGGSPIGAGKFRSLPPSTISLKRWRLSPSTIDVLNHTVQLRCQLGGVPVLRPPPHR